MTTCEQVLALLATPHTRRELREALGCTRSAVDKHLRLLAADGAIKMDGNRKHAMGWAPLHVAVTDADRKHIKRPCLPALVVTDRRRSVLSGLLDRPMTHAEIAAAQGVARKTADSAIRSMQAAGYVEFAGFAKRVESRGPQPWLWRITAKGREAIK